MINLRIKQPLLENISLKRGHILEPEILKLNIMYISNT
jgi:hypothetical protein